MLQATPTLEEFWKAARLEPNEQQPKSREVPHVLLSPTAGLMSETTRAFPWWTIHLIVQKGIKPEENRDWVLAYDTLGTQVSSQPIVSLHVVFSFRIGGLLWQ